MKNIWLIVLISIALVTGSCSKDNPETETAYTVTFDAVGGSPVPKAQKVEADGTATAPAVDPAKTGYVFLFWYLNGTSAAYNFSMPVTADITLKAKWEEEANVEYWQVSWELNGGAWPATGDNHAAQVAKGGTLAEPNAPTKAGKVFDGWYREAALTNKINFPYNVSAVTADIKLYAKWSDPATEYWEIAWELNGGAWPSTGDNHVTKIEKGGKLAEPGAPTKPGKLFAGWYKDAAFTNKVTFPYDVSAVTSNFTLYAKWENSPQAEYFGTWRFTGGDGTWSQFIISADKFEFLYSSGSFFIVENLTWTEVKNSGGDYTANYTDGYRVSGTVTRLRTINFPKENGSGNAAVGDVIAMSFYIYTDKESIRVGNFESAQHEALYGPYNIANVEYWQVTWNLNGGSWPENDNHAVRVAKDGKLAVPANPTKANNNFAGWYTEADLINFAPFPYDASTATGNIKFYAKWTDASPSATLKVSISPGAGFYTSVTAMRNSLGSPSQYSIPTTAGTHTVKVSPGTYHIFYTYWTCQYVSCMSSGISGNFAVSSGQTINISLAGSAVGIQ